uniref:Uncharacterized protein n=1 Tax=Lactuca sativa TaxID=4236 RepID=A0A9R1UQT6_LACSA|nr:hypothetical protein LSAT_V11C800442940 [Lactuca sativa]
MGDQVSDVNNHIYQEQYLTNGIEDFDFPDYDTLYNGGFQIGESSNPNLGQPHVNMITFLLVAPCIDPDCFRRYQTKCYIII